MRFIFWMAAFAVICFLLGITVINDLDKARSQGLRDGVRWAADHERV